MGVPRDALADRMRKLEISESRSRGKFCAVDRTRGSECEQSFNRGDAAASPERHQRHGPGFAFASSESQARAGTIARRNRERSRRHSVRLKSRSAKKTAQKIARPAALKRKILESKRRRGELKKQRTKIKSVPNCTLK